MLNSLTYALGRCSYFFGEGALAAGPCSLDVDSPVSSLSAQLYPGASLFWVDLINAAKPLPSSVPVKVVDERRGRELPLVLIEEDQEVEFL